MSTAYSRKWSDADAAENQQATAYAMLYGYETDFGSHIGLRANATPAVQIVRISRSRDDVDRYIEHIQDVMGRMHEMGRVERIPFPRPATVTRRCAGTARSAVTGITGAR